MSSSFFGIGLHESSAWTSPLRFCSISHTASLMKPAPSTLRRARGPGRRAMTPRSTCRSCSGSSLVIFSGQRQHQGSETSSSSLLRRRLQIGFEALLHPDQNRGIALPPPRNMILWVWPP